MVLALEVSDLAMDLTRRYITISTLIRNNDRSVQNIIAVNEHGVRYTGMCLHNTAGITSLGILAKLKSNRKHHILQVL